MKKIVEYLILFLGISISSFAQWQQEWSSNATSVYYYSGWIAFSEIVGEWDYKFYVIDENSFKIMDSHYSTSPQYQYIFTPEEIQAEYSVYSLGIDLTGDNIVEFYVLSHYGSPELYRQSFKIFDITSNQILFERNNPSYYYSYPVVWDADNDKILECSFAVYDYPTFVNYNYEVYNTNIPTSINSNSSTPYGFNLKQNYPNPFNPRTSIEFSLEKESDVSLTIYDVLGKKVSTLIEKHALPGNHKVDFNGEKLSSGNYFYQLKADGMTTTKKMSVIK